MVSLHALLQINNIQINIIAVRFDVCKEITTKLTILKITIPLLKKVTNR